MIGNLKKNQKEIKLINEKVEKLTGTTDQFIYESSQANNQFVFSLKNLEEGLNAFT